MVCRGLCKSERPCMGWCFSRRSHQWISKRGASEDCRGVYRCTRMVCGLSAEFCRASSARVVSRGCVWRIVGGRRAYYRSIDWYCDILRTLYEFELFIVGEREP